MSIEIDVQSFGSAATDTQIHHVPCEIEHDGEANVEKYFASSHRPHTEEGNESKFTKSSIRGRPVIGSKVETPSGYTMVVLNERSKPFNEDEERCFRAMHKVDAYMHWNLDEAPSSNDKAQMARQWLDIASVLHSPIEDVDSQSSTVSR